MGETPKPPARPVPSLAVLRVAVLSGPNLDRLGTREPAIYGTTTLAEVHLLVEEAARAAGAVAVGRQSNHEGDLVSWIGAAREEGFAGVVLNAGAYTHTSIAILDAIKASGVPVIEVHLSNPDAREPFRRRSRIAPVCLARVAGFGPQSYVLGLQGLLHHLRHVGGHVGGEASSPLTPRTKRGALREPLPSSRSVR